MNNQKGIDFLKNRIKERLLSVADQMGRQRYRLYLAMVEECNDFEDLKEMAELDLQMELFDYIKNEITPRLDEMNMSISDIRKLDVGEYPRLDTPTQHFDIEPSDIEALMDDPEANAAMAMLLMNRIANEPAEERYRQEILDFQLEEKMDVDTIDEIGDLGDFEDMLEEADDEEDEDFDDSDFGSLLDDEGELEDDEEDTDEDYGELDNLLDEPEDYSDEAEGDEEEVSDDQYMDELDGFFDEEESGVMSEDEIFDDSADLDELMDSFDDDIESGIMTEDEIFVNDIDDIDFSDGDDGFIDSEEDDESIGESNPDDIDDLGDYDFGDLEADPDPDELGDIDDIDDFDGLEDIDTEEDEESGFSDIDDIEDSDGLLGEDDEDGPFEKEDDYDPFGELNDAEIDSMMDDEEQSNDSEDDPFSELDDADFGDLDDAEEDNDPFSELDDADFGDDIDSIGLIDDSEELLSGSKEIAVVNKPNNVNIHTPSKPTRQQGIKPTTVFRDGTTRGDKTQDMFNVFNNIGSGASKFAKKAKTTGKKVMGSKAVRGIATMGMDDIEIDF